MSKYYGKIGFATTTETSPGIYKEVITERRCYGDVLRFYRRTETETKVNSDINLTNEFSIVADPFARDNLSAIRYITFAGAKWKVNSVDVQYPRLNITVGGLWNEQTED